MKLGRRLRHYFKYGYKSVSTRQALGKGQTLFLYLKYICLLNLGGSKQVKLGKLKVFTPDFLHFLHLYEEIFIDGCYQVDLSAKSPRILDAGGNMGMASLYFKTLYPEARIDSFEANLESVQLLQRNYEVNHWVGCQAHHLAISDHEGELTFYSRESDKISSVNSSRLDRIGDNAYQEMKVKCQTLSHYLTEKIDLLKMDIEGAEMDVFRELEQSGKLENIENMFLEYHHHLEKNVDEFSEFLAILERNHFGYVITSWLKLPTWKNRFQDILIFAYKK